MTDSKLRAAAQDLLDGMDIEHRTSKYDVVQVTHELVHALRAALDAPEEPCPIEEDLMQKIWDISAIPLPGLDRIGRGSVTAQKCSWLCDQVDEERHKLYDERDQLRAEVERLRAALERKP